MTYHKIIFFLTVALILLMSLVSFILFLIDKKRAIKGKDRVKEKTLLASSACFGAAGALIGRKVAHHKTEKLYFGIVIWFSLILQVLLIAYTLYIAFLR